MKIRYGRGDYIFTLCKYTECAIFGMRKRIVATLTCMASRLRTRRGYSKVQPSKGWLVNGLEITVIYSDRKDDERRIISAWRAEPHERRYYWKNIEGDE